MGLATPDIGAVGDNTIDRYSGVHDARYVGGNALNVAAQLAIGGLDVGYFGAVGSDPDGCLVSDRLRNLDIGLDGLHVLAGHTSATRIRLTSTRNRVFVEEDPGVTRDYFPSETDLVQLSACAWVHIGMVPRADELRRELHHRRRVTGRGPVISQDCAVAEGMAFLDVAFGSVAESEDAALRWLDSVREAEVEFGIAMMGAAGAMAFSGDRLLRKHVVPTDVVDTTGAGDSFIAGFISAMHRGSEIEGAMDVAMRWAARACAHYGGWPQDRGLDDTDTTTK